MAAMEEEAITCATDEGAEFISGFSDVNVFTQDALRSLMVAVKSSNELPNTGEDFNYYSSFPAYQEIMNVEGKRMLEMMHDIMRHCGVKGNLTDKSRSLEIEDKFDILVDANDQILERAGSLLDDAEGLKKKDTKLVIASATAKDSYTASWNKKKTGPDSKPTKYRLLTARNIQRPQLKFSDKIDNTSSPFVPKIKQKPNAIKPLQDCFTINRHSEEMASEIDGFSFPHPYQYELDHFTPPKSQLQKVKATKPAAVSSRPASFIDTEAGLEKLCELLKKQTEIAVDLEHHSYRSFQGFTCLMQISTRDSDFLVDAIELRNKLQSLNEVFTDPKIVKVLHGSDSDMDWLQRDLGLYVVNMFDTGQAARVLNLARFSLAHLLKQYCDVEADKQYQLADWRIRPLPEELCRYAQEDTHYLLYIYDCLKNELIERGNDQTNLLLSVLQRSTQLCLKVYKKPLFTEENYLELHKKSRKRFNSRQLHALKEIYKWRDEIARSEDESLGYVLPSHMMLQIAEILPRELQGILACCNPIPPLVHQCATEIHRIVMQARELPLEKVTSKRQPLGPQRYEHPKYETNSLLDSPHDFSHVSKQKSTEHAEGQQLDKSLISETSTLFTDNLLKPAEAKKTPIISFTISHETQQESRLSDAQKTAARIRASFISPFEKYLPESLGKLIQRKYGQQTEKTNDVQINQKWKLLSNTKGEPKPSNAGAERAVVSKPVPDADFIGATEADDAQPIRQKKSKKRCQEENVLKDETEKVEKPGKKLKHSEKKSASTSNTSGETQQTPEPFDYTQAAAKLFEEVKKEQKRKEYDGNALNEQYRNKGPSKSKQYQKFGKKSMTYKRDSGSNQYGGSQRQNWPKR